MSGRGTYSFSLGGSAVWKSTPGTVRFARGAPDLHVLWGWLQVDCILKFPAESVPSWAQYHPHAMHATSAAYCTKNTLYVATRGLRIGSDSLPLPGGGVFRRYDPRLQLTKSGRNRSVWCLPTWFAPSPGRRALGYHDDSARWSVVGDQVELQTVARGQEFVLDAIEYPESLHWVLGLLGD